MSEHDEQRPMTRRERRLREMGQSPETATPPPAASPDPAPAAAPTPAGPAQSFDISPYNEDGSLRSRAEMRALRAQLEAAAAEPSPAPAAEPDQHRTAHHRSAVRRERVRSVQPEPVAPEPAIPEPPAAEPTAAEPEAVVPELDVEAIPPTQPFTVGELFEAESGSPEPTDIPVEATPVEEVEPEPESEETGYSFPDIRPPEEWRSVFDDPSSRALGEESDAGVGDFDSLIERAVAQEGFTGTANTAALIMPTHQDDTGGLTGDLFVTGSIELPQSLAETGGHSDTHDSLKLAPILPVDEPTELPTAAASTHGPVPVSATSAVSARGRRDMPIVAPPAKESSKLPLILSLTGGGLIVVIGGLGYWAWQSGMFG